MIITRTTIARKAQELFNDEKHYGSWSHGGNNKLADSEYRHMGYTKAWEQLIPAHGWPGGYDMAYYPTDEFGSLVDEFGSLIGDVLCWGCAREFLKNNKAVAPDAGYGLRAESCDGWEGEDSDDHLYCGDCNGVICEAWQREEDLVAD